MKQEAPDLSVSTSQVHKPIKGFVYFIQSDKAVKIGYTKQNPAKRLSQLQTGSLEQLKLLHFIPHENCRSLERRLHYMFRGYKARFNSEWFNLPVEVIDWILDWRTEKDIQ
jgi:Meiotically up-regulated gene 113